MKNLGFALIFLLVSPIAITSCVGAGDLSANNEQVVIDYLKENGTGRYYMTFADANKTIALGYKDGDFFIGFNRSSEFSQYLFVSSFEYGASVIQGIFTAMDYGQTVYDIDTVVTIKDHDFDYLAKGTLNVCNTTPQDVANLDRIMETTISLTLITITSFLLDNDLPYIY